jgi:hypothetical protein
LAATATATSKAVKAVILKDYSRSNQAINKSNDDASPLSSSVATAKQCKYVSTLALADNSIIHRQL